MGKYDKSKPKAAPPKAPAKKITKTAFTPIPKPGGGKRGDALIGKKRQKEARSAAIGAGIMKQM